MPSESSHRLPRTCQRSDLVVFLGVSYLMETHSFWISNASVPPPPSLAFALLMRHENPQPLVIPGLPCSLSAFLIFTLLLRLRPFAWGGVSTEPLSLGGGCDCEGVQSHRARVTLTTGRSHCADFYTCKIRRYSRNPVPGVGKCSRTKKLKVQSSFSLETISQGKVDSLRGGAMDILIGLASLSWHWFVQGIVLLGLSEEP